MLRSRTERHAAAASVSAVTSSAAADAASVTGCGVAYAGWAEHRTLPELGEGHLDLDAQLPVRRGVGAGRGHLAGRQEGDGE